MELEGLFVALVTPFDSQGALDEDGLRSNIEYLIEKGVSGIVPCGTTGESATLSWEEHNEVVRIALDQSKKRVLVIAGAGSNNTRESIEAAQHAKENGADAILCITPYYNKPTQEGLFRHFEAITREVEIPIVAYNVPGRTGVNMLPHTVERLCDLPSVVAIKEASGDILQVSEIHRRCGDRLTILSGDDALTMPIITCGGKGVISVVGNFVPDWMTKLVSSSLQGDMQTALQVHEKLLRVANAMFLETNPIPVKTTMNHLGLSGGPLRLPLVAMNENNKRELISVLESSGIQPISRE